MFNFFLSPKKERNMAGKDEDKPFIQKHAALIFVAIFLVFIGGAYLDSRRTKNRSW